jgi:hypothetical protein
MELRKLLLQLRRAGKAVRIAGLIGFCRLPGLEGSLHSDFGPHQTPQEDGRECYGWIVGLEIVALVIGGFSRIARAVSEDRQAGLWDSNRLTPLKAWQMIAGYWFAPALREFYMAVVLAGFGLLITLGSGLPLTLWLGTQVLIANPALFFGLPGILAGLARQRSQGSLIILLELFIHPWSFESPSLRHILQGVSHGDTPTGTQTPVPLGHDLTQVVTAWPKLPAALQAAMLAIVNSSGGCSMSASPTGETCEETVSQGGGVFISLSGGDERSEPESPISSSSPASDTDGHADGEGPAPERGGAWPGAGLPCQYSDNCIGKDSSGKPVPLSPDREKSRHRLEMAIVWMVGQYGLERVGLLTLSFGVPGSGRGSEATRELREQAKDFGIMHFAKAGCDCK